MTTLETLYTKVAVNEFAFLLVTHRRCQKKVEDPHLHTDEAKTIKAKA
jgi:hypothetical protein